MQLIEKKSHNNELLEYYVRRCKELETAAKWLRLWTLAYDPNNKKIRDKGNKATKRLFNLIANNIE
jgi:hypothetical protein